MPDSCGEIITEDRLLDTHLRSASDSKGLPCPTCCACFETRELLRQHVSDGYHLVPALTVSLFCCVLCLRVCADQEDLDYHDLLHDLRCDSCDLDFPTQWSFNFRRTRFHEYQSQSPVSAGSWFNTIRREISSSVQYTQAPDEPVQAGAVHSPAQQARRASGYDISLFSQLGAWQFPPTTISAIPGSGIRQSANATSPAQQYRRLSPRTGREPAPRQHADLITPIQQAPVHQASYPTSPRTDPTSSTGTWAVNLNTQTVQTRQPQRQSDLSRPAPAPRPFINGILPAQQSPYLQAAQITSPSITQLVPLQPARQLIALSFPGPAPRQLTNIIPHVQQAPARQLRPTGTPSTTGPAAVQQAPLSFSRPMQQRVAQQAPTRQPERPFRCESCSWQFNSRHGLNRHCTAVPRRNPIPEPVGRAREIPDAPRWKCLSCQKTFINQFALDQHLAPNAQPENRIDGQPGYRCTECAMVFGTRDLLTLHAAEHVQERMRQ